LYNHENFIELLDNRLYGEAWTMWDKGLTQQEINREFDTIPRWDGSDLTGKNILVWAEGLIGDQVMFCSLIKSLIKKNPKNITLELDQRLINLMKRSFYSNKKCSINYIPFKQWKIASHYFDVQVSMGSLVRYLKFSPELIEERESYLKVDDKVLIEKKIQYRELSGGRKIVGLSNVGREVVPFTMFQQLMNNTDLFFINIDKVPGNYPNVFIDSEVDETGSPDELATQIAACDDIVCFDNKVVHIAGALGKTTRLILQPDCDWRWLKDRKDSIWYTNVALYRLLQDKNNSIPEIMKKISEEF